MNLYIEGHDIKLINLAGLGNGNYAETPGKFFDWIKQILILPTGDLKRNIFNKVLSQYDRGIFV